jgi:hypothetical protein
MRVFTALLVAALAFAPPALACDDTMTLAEVIKTASDEFARNPRSTIHRCFLPFMERLDAEPSLDVREQFLFLVITKTAKRPPRVHNVNLIVDASESYFLLLPQLASPQPARVAEVLSQWGRAVLLGNRERALLVIHLRYLRTTDGRLAYLNDGKLARKWLSVMRCSADRDGCRSQPNCALEGECGESDAIREKLAADPALRERWKQFVERLEAADQNAVAATLDEALDLMGPPAS